MVDIRRVPASTPAQEINKILEEDGCIVIENLLKKNDLKSLQEELFEKFEKIPLCQGHFFGFTTKRMSGLMTKSRTSQDLAIHPLILEVMDHFLLKGCREYQLNLTQAIQIFPGETAQIIHTDDLMFPFKHPEHEAMINCMWAIDDFTAENGATHIVPGSHKWPAGLNPEPYKPLSGTMPAGSVLIYFGSLLHGGGANVSQKPRMGLVMSYCLGWLRQAENHYLSIPIEQVRQFPSRLQKLLGYFVHEPNLGCVEGQSPARLLEGHDIVNGRFDEFLTPTGRQVDEEYRKNLKQNTSVEQSAV